MHKEILKRPNKAKLVYVFIVKKKRTIISTTKKSNTKKTPKINLSVIKE
jgi:hypothetical protein